MIDLKAEGSRNKKNYARQKASWLFQDNFPVEDSWNLIANDLTSADQAIPDWLV